MRGVRAARGRRSATGFQRTLVFSGCLAALGALPGAWANPAVLLRQAPAGFSAVQGVQRDQPLTFRGHIVPDVVFVVDAADERRLSLVPNADAAYRRFLSSLGLDADAIRDLLGGGPIEAGRTRCLALAATPQLCVEVIHSLLADGKVELTVREDRKNLLDAALVQSPSLMGSTVVSLGADGGAGARTFSGSLNTRGIASSGALRLEYDLSWSMRRSGTGGSASGARYDLLAASMPLRADGPEGAAGTVFAGLFRAGSAGAVAGVGSAFLVHPAVFGLAYRSDVSSIQAFGRARKVRVVLQQPALVRILRNGVPLKEVQLPAGDQFVSFTGYDDDFLSVEVRDAAGNVKVESAEVFRDDAGPGLAVPSADGRRHFFFADAGRLLTTSSSYGTGLRAVPASIVNAGYVYVGDWWMGQVEFQSVVQRSRVAATLVPRDGSWRVAAQSGGGGEAGLTFAGSATFGSWLWAASLTRYRPPGGTGRPVQDVCTFQGVALCYGTSEYSSASLGLGYADFPIRLTYMTVKSGAAPRLGLVNLQGSFRLPSLSRGAFLVLLAGYSPHSRSRSVSANLTIPLERTMLTGSVSSSGEGQLSTSVGYSMRFDEDESAAVRSISLGAQSSRAGGAVAHAASGYVVSDFGPVRNNTGLSTQSGGHISGFSSFNASYGWTPSGLAWTRADDAGITSNLFDDRGFAGVSVFNRSREAQTLRVEGRSIEVPANTNRLVQLPTGYVRELAVLPGPVSDSDDPGARRYLRKGNVREINIGDGYWVIGAFIGPDGEPLLGAMTYRGTDERAEKLYPDSRGRHLIYELSDAGAATRVVVDRKGRKFDCRLPPNAAATSDLLAYTEIDYRCERLPDVSPATSPADDRGALPPVNSPH